VEDNQDKSRRRGTSRHVEAIEGNQDQSRHVEARRGNRGQLEANRETDKSCRCVFDPPAKAVPLMHPRMHSLAFPQSLQVICVLGLVGHRANERLSFTLIRAVVQHALASISQHPFEWHAPPPSWTLRLALAPWPRQEERVRPAFDLSITVLVSCDPRRSPCFVPGSSASLTSQRHCSRHTSPSTIVLLGTAGRRGQCEVLCSHPHPFWHHLHHFPHVQPSWPPMTRPQMATGMERSSI